jgi:hypothetical protein
MTMKIENYGVGERCAEAMRRLMSWDVDGVEKVILLPIPTSRDGIHLTGSEKLLREALGDVSRGELVVGYAIPDADAEYIRSKGGAVCDVARDEEFVDENARITAIGTLEYLLTGFNLVPSDMKIGIVGYGRIGRHLARILLFLGAKIRIYTSKNLTRVELGGCGVESRVIDYDSAALEDLDELDVLINTAPTPLADCFEGRRIPRGLSVIELASGNNFDGVEGVIKLPSIPERNYPKTAGRAYFHAIQRYMREVFDI